MRHTIKTLTSDIYPKSKGYYTITRDGQESINLGNKVIIKIMIFLPCGKGTTNLSEHIKCNGTLNIVDSPLYLNWGRYVSDDSTTHRYTNKYIQGTKWKDLFDEGCEYAHKELMKLEHVLIEREQALIDAEIIEE